MPATRLVILGKQGAGKGTQAERLATHYDAPRISTGDILRHAVRTAPQAGHKAAAYMEAGELVPDEVVVDVVDARLREPDTRTLGFVLDGFPRNVFQAQALEGLLAPNGVDLVVELVVPTQVVLRRLASRRVCLDCGANYSVDVPPDEEWKCDRCGGKVVQREDDTEQAILRRLELYRQETEPLVAWYLGQDKLAQVDGNGAADTVTARLLRAIDNRLQRGPDGAGRTGPEHTVRAAYQDPR